MESYLRAEEVSQIVHLATAAACLALEGAFWGRGLFRDDVQNANFSPDVYM